MLIVFKRDELGFPSFWQLQIMGWVGLYVLAVVGSIPDFLQRPAVLRDTTVAALFMFLATFALRPICRSLRDCRSILPHISPFPLLMGEPMR